MHISSPTLSAVELHQDAMVVDACAPILRDLGFAPLWLEGGANCAMATVALHDDDLPAAMAKIAAVLRQAGERNDVQLVRTASDIDRARRVGKLAVVLMFQSSRALSRNLDMAAVYHQLGVRSINLAYNVAEDAADGCMEPRNGGLTIFGRQLVAEMHRLGIVLDLSHTSYRASMEAIERSPAPVIFSHSNAASVFDHPRNLRDDQIAACATTGGVIGLNGHPVFVRQGTTEPSIDDLMRHLEYLVQTAGIDHVGLGLDFSQLPGGQMSPLRYQQMLNDGVWTSETLPPPPWRYPVGNAGLLSQLTGAMVQHGWNTADIRKVLGENFLRVFRAVWRSDHESKAV